MVNNLSDLFVSHKGLTIACALLAVVAFDQSTAQFSPLVATAVAAEAGHGGGHGGDHGGGCGGGHGGGCGGGHEGDHGEEPGHGIGEVGGHLPGPKGFGGRGAHQGRYGVQMEHSAAASVEDMVFRGRPVWAQEGIPEVELGRLNVSRAPGFVLSRAEAEALSRFTPQMASLYDMSAAEAAQLLKTDYDQVPRIDSPVQNLALYKDVMIFGKTQLPGVHPSSVTDLAAIFLGSASDKTMPITENTVIAVNRILGLIELSPGERAALASKAEAVRQAILIGHGETEH